MDYFLQKVCGRPARQTITPAALHPCRGTGGVRAAKRSARRHAAPGAVRAGYAGKHYRLSAYRDMHRCVAAKAAGGVPHPALCGRSAENYAAFLGVPQSQWQHWANADSAVVHPDWRGNGLQRAMLEAALPLLPPQITHLGATVSPDNNTACAMHRPAALSSAAAGRCTAGTTAICWKSSCNSMQFWCTTFSKCVILYGMNNSEGNR